MDSSKLEKHERRKIQFAKLKSGVSKWNIINDSKEYVMCLVGLYSSDSKTDHAVSIAGDWIFDSNSEYALPGFVLFLGSRENYLCWSNTCMHAQTSGEYI
jgi:hypothetical protein